MRVIRFKNSYLRMLLPVLLAIVSVFGVSVSGRPLLAEEPKQVDNFAGFFKESSVSAFLRPRYEFVDQDNLEKHANAYTLLSRIGVESANYKGLSGALGFENVSSLAEETFNNTINNKTDYPVVADPENTSIDKAYLAYDLPEKLKVLYGRRTLNLDNQRFVGEVGWRQNHQTFDGTDLIASISPEMKFAYYYISQVNRVFGEDSPQDIYNSEIHLLNSAYSFDKDKKVSVFSYMVDLENSDSQSNVSSGLRAQALFATEDADLKIPLEASYAYQNEYADNPDTFDNNYIALETGLNFRRNKIKVGYESLGSDGKFAFQTPLATLHAFNGWADMFLKTPEKGLQDFYIGYSLDLDPFMDIGKGIKIETALHHFCAEYGNLEYGKEVDLALINQISESTSIALHYADYLSDQLYSDTQKFWFSVSSKLNLA